MRIRNYQEGDEAAQAAIYNEMAAALPKFKPATAEEVRRRCRARDFDPGTRFYAEENGQVVGYATWQANGRVSYPWCRPGHEALAEPLFQAVLEGMKRAGLKSAFAAYRGDWTVVGDFFKARSFRSVREMVNFVLELADLPTLAFGPKARLTPLRPNEVPILHELGAGVLRMHTPAELERYFFHNPYFTPESLFTLRPRDGDLPAAVGILISNIEYADPRQVDAGMPCFRLGAFGTEGMTTKRLKGLFSFVARNDSNLGRYGIDLLGFAAGRLEESDAEALAAQVPSDAPHLLRFYQQHFRKQGSFPVFERTL
jgi:hypothetical protein